MASDLDKIIDENFSDHYRSIKCGYYKGVWLPEEYLKIADEIENFKTRDDDVWVCSFPRSGSTWTQEMVWCICTDLDYEKAKIPSVEKFLYLEASGTTTAAITMLKKGLWDSKFNIEKASRLPSPRYFKSHLPFHLLPKELRMGKSQAKIVYIMRNPKDVCISYYHLRVTMKVYFGTLENYCRLFIEDKLAYTPFWQNLISYWEAKDSKNIHFLKFEDMKKDLPSCIKGAAKFFGKSFSDSQIASLCDYLSFERMKNNSSTNPANDLQKVLEIAYGEKNSKVTFIRKGQSDQWKTDMSEDLIKKFDDWTSENIKDHPDLRAHLF